MRFRNNQDLLAFAEELLDFLRSEREIELADQLAHASRFFSGSSSEFLNEVYIALKNVLVAGPRALSAEREEEIRQAVRHIDEAFHAAGGT